MWKTLYTWDSFLTDQYGGWPFLIFLYKYEPCNRFLSNWIKENGNVNNSMHALKATL